MSGFRKKTIPEQFADTLSADIRSDAFGGLLPSVRDLGLRYGLNIVSVHKGLVLLVQRGVLLNRGPRRRLAIAPPAGAPLPAAGFGLARACRPLIFIGAELGEVSPAVLLAMREIEGHCAEKGGRCVTVDLSGLGLAEKGARVRAALGEHKPTHVLMVYCDQSTCALLARKPIKLAAVGGSVVGRKVARLTIDPVLLSTVAFDDLRTLGHRRFRMVMLGHPEVPAERRRLLDYSAAARVEALGVWGGRLDVRSMSAALAAGRRQGVTGFVFLRPEAMVLAQACFDTAGVRVPKDVSLVLLSSGSYDFMQSTQPAHFKFRKEAMVSLILNWFEFDEVTSERISREVAATYVRGRTVGPAKAPR
jgi:DNA-binding LacI/PurR family transcriptional regulator